MREHIATIITSLFNGNAPKQESKLTEAAARVHMPFAKSQSSAKGQTDAVNAIAATLCGAEYSKDGQVGWLPKASIRTGYVTAVDDPTLAPFKFEYAKQSTMVIVDAVVLTEKGTKLAKLAHPDPKVNFSVKPGKIDDSVARTVHFDFRRPKGGTSRDGMSKLWSILPSGYDSEPVNEKGERIDLDDCIYLGSEPVFLAHRRCRSALGECGSASLVWFNGRIRSADLAGLDMHVLRDSPELCAILDSDETDAEKARTLTRAHGELMSEQTDAAIHLIETKELIDALTGSSDTDDKASLKVHRKHAGKLSKQMTDNVVVWKSRQVSRATRAKGALAHAGATAGAAASRRTMFDTHDVTDAPQAGPQAVTDAPQAVAAK